MKVKVNINGMEMEVELSQEETERITNEIISSNPTTEAETSDAIFSWKDIISEFVYVSTHTLFDVEELENEEIDLLWNELKQYVWDTVEPSYTAENRTFDALTDFFRLITEEDDFVRFGCEKIEEIKNNREKYFSIHFGMFYNGKVIIKASDRDEAEDIFYNMDSYDLREYIEDSPYDWELVETGDGMTLQEVELEGEENIIFDY